MPGRSNWTVSPSGVVMAVATFFWPLTILASPRAKTIIASVAMNGCTLHLAVNTPDVPPQTAPTARHAGTAIQGGQPQWMLISENVTAPSANTLPTERSIPPLTITNVIPQARMP